MIENIYSLFPDTTPTVYDQEEFTTLRLVSKLTGKVNECINVVNSMTGTGTGTGTYDPSKIIDVTKEGVKGDGSDETIKLQAALDKTIINHAVFYVPKGVTVTTDQLIINGAINFAIKIEGVLKRKSSAISPHAMLQISDSNNFVIWSYNGDGNVQFNGVSLNEHQHILTLAACHDVYISHLTGKNISGDLIHVDNVYNLQCDTIYGYSNDTGRNTLSIIKGYNLQFNDILSIGVGTISMPGGIDVEPNYATDDCYNIQFGNVYVETNGFSGFSLTNNPNALCHDIIAENVIVRKKTIARSTPVHTNTGIIINKFDRVKITGTVTELQVTKTNLSTLGLWVNGGTDITVDISIHNVYKGMILGYYDVSNLLNITGSMDLVFTHGIESALLNNSVIDVSVKDCDYGEVGDAGCVLLEYGADQSNVIYRGKYIKESYGTYGIRWTGGATRTNITFDVDFIGFAEDHISNQNTELLNYNMKHLIWYALSLSDSWTAKGGNDYTPSYTKDINGNVHMRGTATGGTATADANVAVTLPAAIVPPKNIVVPSIRGGSIYVAHFGAIKIDSDVTGDICFANIHYNVKY